MKFEIEDVDALARLGRISLNGKEMITPNLFPVVHPFRNNIAPHDLKTFGAQCLFTNAYIIYKNEKLRTQVLQKGLITMELLQQIVVHFNNICITKTLLILMLPP